MYKELNEHFLITESEFKELKSKEKIKISCSFCKNTYERTKHDVQSIYRKNKTRSFLMLKELSIRI